MSLAPRAGGSAPSPPTSTRALLPPWSSRDEESVRASSSSSLRTAFDTGSGPSLASVTRTSLPSADGAIVPSKERERVLGRPASSADPCDLRRRRSSRRLFMLMYFWRTSICTWFGSTILLSRSCRSRPSAHCDSSGMSITLIPFAARGLSWSDVVGGAAKQMERCPMNGAFGMKRTPRRSFPDICRSVAYSLRGSETFNCLSTARSAIFMSFAAVKVSASSRNAWSPLPFELACETSPLSCRWNAMAECTIGGLEPREKCSNWSVWTPLGRTLDSSSWRWRTIRRDSQGSSQMGHIFARTALSQCAVSVPGAGFSHFSLSFSMRSFDTSRARCMLSTIRK
mmetsp:Transcript_8555/g.31611  ORF Transcript_8555/g.31611 Transcript_8555/m.31611 type:complete len:341 (+) Transcript_8555:1969-2991(+)